MAATSGNESKGHTEGLLLNYDLSLSSNMLHHEEPEIKTKEKSFLIIMQH